MRLNRREFSAFALAALARGDSKWGGVEIGLNVPYCFTFRGMPSSADDILTYVRRLGVASVEMRSQTVEAYLGAPNSLGIEPEDVAAGGTALENWRLGASMERFREFRKKYAEIAIPVVKFDGMERMKDAVIDYAFSVAKALGARALACSVPVSAARRVGEFAARHKMMVGYHGTEDLHAADAFATPESWEKAMSYSKYNGINLDIGHFVAANNTSPIAFLKKYADRVTHVHLTDRKRNNGAFTVWGEGDAPIRETLALMKRERYPFPGIIECEYPLPEGSDGMREIAKCVEFCRRALV